ncbi:MAG: PKD domain-containing protein, partial [Candidatus Poseidoniia archaeon]|nr:PKD domain-containing protein [Candidatus Poseidoniia archaeon]
WLFDEDNNLEDEFEINGVELAEQNAAPVIDALYVDDGDEGEELSFSVSAHDDDDDDLTYAWDFGDGETDSGESVSHTYADNDDYTVTVTVSDGDAEDTDSATVEIANLAPTLSVDGPGSGSEGQERSFEADTNDVEADTVSVTWDFGDGETATGDVVSHTWSDDDSYTVVVIASDEDGDETVEMVTITINNLAPTLQISSSSISGDEGDTFTFTATVSDVPADPISVTW